MGSLPDTNVPQQKNRREFHEESESTLKDDLARLEAASSGTKPSPTEDFKPLTTKPTKPPKPLYARIRWFNLTVIVITPIMAVYGIITTHLHPWTALFTFFYFWWSTSSCTAGYHRLWSHRSYTASIPLQYWLAIGGASSLQGSIRWWARGHRSHHRYIDTDLDPYNAKSGFWFSHVGWMLVDPVTPAGRADVSDLSKSRIVMWQRKYYFQIAFTFGIFVPWLIPGLCWGDWRGGFYYAALARMVASQHVIFCVNSFAHWLGDASYDDKHTPRDNFVTALMTFGEGYHNFHHQFPMDYRNAVKYYQFDPNKWFIYACSKVGLAWDLQRFSSNEIHKARFAMDAKKLLQLQEDLDWGKKRDEVPLIDWESFQEESRSRPLVLVAGYVHDVSSMLHRHPGGQVLLEGMIGKDGTAAFFGGVHQHTSVAMNMLSNMRVAALEGGVETIPADVIKKSKMLYIAQGRYDE